MTMLKKYLLSVILMLFIWTNVRATFVLIPMDNTQKNHLKAYGIAYWILTHEVDVQWLLNYRGGSFMFKYDKSFENECVIRGVTFEVVADSRSSSILTEIADPE